MNLTAYHPSIRRLQLDFASRLARKRMLAGRPRTSKTITDNSVPWLENPNCVADYIYISNKVRESEIKWRSRFNPSSTN